MQIGLDFDGVITHLGKLKALVTEKLFDKKVHKKHHGHFDLLWVMEQKLLTDVEYEALKTYAYYEKGALAHMHAVRGALTGINTLLARGHEIKIITAREGESLKNVEEWLGSRKLNLEVIGVGFENTKHKAAKGLDVFVDDYLIQLYHLRDEVPHRFLYSWEYNKRYDEKQFAVRVSSWSELTKKIIDLEDKKTKNVVHRKGR
jgi:uncharacterized HAD superfamily protein